MGKSTLSDVMREQLAKVMGGPVENILEDMAKRSGDDMTNWQRNQWARAGYPPSRKGEFAAMVRPHAR